MTAFTPTFLYLTGGLVIWGVRFLALYSFTGLACARGWADPSDGIGVVQAAAIVLTVLALAGCGALILRAVTEIRAREVDETEENIAFVHYVAGTVAALAALAILFEGLSFLFVPVCA